MTRSPLSRRALLRHTLASPLLAPWAAGVSVLHAAPEANPWRRLLILVELRGANDGLNTWVPHAGPAREHYLRARPTIGLPAEQVVKLTATHGLHPSLEPLASLWAKGEMAVIEGLGYPEPNLSHFRSIEIWDTASRSDQYLHEGWLARAFAERKPPAAFFADAVSVGSGDLGPFASGARALAIASPEAFMRQARLADPHGRTGNRALEHVLRLEAEARGASGRLDLSRTLGTRFPAHAFGQQVKSAMQILAGSPGVAALRIGLGSFDTHQGQLGTHAALLRQLAEGVLAMREALTELGRWPDTLIVTYCEFGRRVRENESGGTDHGTANMQLAFGGALRGGTHGTPPDLADLDARGNPRHTVDFRSLYATLLTRWWGFDAAAAERVLGGRYTTLDLA